MMVIMIYTALSSSWPCRRNGSGPGTGGFQVRVLNLNLVRRRFTVFDRDRGTDGHGDRDIRVCRRHESVARLPPDPWPGPGPATLGGGTRARAGAQAVATALPGRRPTVTARVSTRAGVPGPTVTGGGWAGRRTDERRASRSRGRPGESPRRPGFLRPRTPTGPDASAGAAAAEPDPDST